MQIVATAIFALAILHTFSTKFFERLAHSRPAHSGVWHLLAEVEIVFGFWALVMAVVMFSLQGTDATKTYINGRNFTEPMFVFVIMVVAGTRPVLHTAKQIVQVFARLLPLRDMRAAPELASMRVLAPGNRLSITPVTPEEWRAVGRLLAR